MLHPSPQDGLYCQRIKILKFMEVLFLEPRYLCSTKYLPLLHSFLYVRQNELRFSPTFLSHHPYENSDKTQARHHITEKLIDEILISHKDLIWVLGQKLILMIHMLNFRPRWEKQTSIASILIPPVNRIRIFSSPNYLPKNFSSSEQSRSLSKAEKPL